MTGNLLLYGGAIHLAGNVKSHKAGVTRLRTDGIEKQRGISVTSSVMQFDAKAIASISWTPAQDFSKIPTALPCRRLAVMLLTGPRRRAADHQALPRLSPARHHFCIINKMDRAAKNLRSDDELKVLGIRSAPINWPIGTHGDFKGIRSAKAKIDFSAGARTAAPSRRSDRLSPDDPNPQGSEQHYIDQLAEDIELLDIAGDPLDEELVAAGLLTPLFFGSALTNFGVEPFLREFLRMAPAPSARKSNLGPVQPDDEAFSGFVFKIQANMNPQHRDRLAFIRICSGVFQPEMDATLTRTGRPVRLARPQQIMAQERVSRPLCRRHCRRSIRATF